jgi:hypothetical protein
MPTKPSLADLVNPDPAPAAFSVDSLLGLLSTIGEALLDDGAIDRDEWAEIVHAARLLVLDGHSLDSALAHVLAAIKGLTAPKPERLLARAIRLEERAARLRARAATDSP